MSQKEIIKNILVVEDNIDNAKLLVNILETADVTYNILLAKDGEKAFNIIKSTPIDLIISDWDMPIKNGLELVKDLQKTGLTDIPIIICSGVNIESTDMQTALDVGAYDFVRKPINRIELLARVKSLLKLIEVHQNLKIQKIQLENKQRQIDESLSYARRIQTAILSSENILYKYFSDYFIFLKPRDIVSGDFYWLAEHNHCVFVAVVDCTGHGIPGAFVSMLGIAFLNESVRNIKTNSPAEILEILRTKFKETLANQNNLFSLNDGMDMALCLFDKNNMILNYAGANNPIYQIRDNELILHKPTRNPIGKYTREVMFEDIEIKLEKNDLFYLFSDGYIDQLNEEGEKFKPRRFKELLLENNKSTLEQQKFVINQQYEEWKNDKYPQIDDILVIGIRI